MSALQRPAGPLFLPCAGGAEALLAEECTRLLGAAVPVSAVRGGVMVAGGARQAMRLNLESRLAQRVLWPLVRGVHHDERGLYELARRVDWPAWITPDQTLAVHATAVRSPLHSLNFAALKVKDAVCDALRERHGVRPSVDTHAPHLPLALHLHENQAALYVDTSGEALFKRGWRDERQAARGGGAGSAKGEAPLKETLAAAMLAAADWQGRAEDGPLLDPCCGAGTIAIEAAQLACGMAPGLRRRFAFEPLAPFQALLPEWRALKSQAQARIHAPAVAVHAGDVAFRMTDIAQRNAERAGVGHAIAFKTADATQRPPPAPAGLMVLNPPYGERIAAKGVQRAGREQAEAGQGPFFAALAAHWKRHYAGWSAWVLSPDPELPTALRLKPSRRVPMWNGAIECRLMRFELVAGSARTTRAAAGSGGPPSPNA